MLKQRKTGLFDEQSSPDGNHYLSKEFIIFFFISWFLFFKILFIDNDECSSDGSNNSQKELIFTD
jgi:hypothetical protein